MTLRQATEQYGYLMDQLKFNDFYELVDIDQRRILTSILLSAGTNPLNYLNKVIPLGFAYDLNNELPSNIVIHSGILEIQKAAFFRCPNIKSLITEKVEDINDFAFSECANLQTIEFGEGLYEISEHAFSFCSSLKEVHFPYSVEHIQNKAFYNCENLTKITYQGTMEEWSYVRIYSRAFLNCPATKV